ncbi:MAG: adenylate/guanylate cyclase domain-containing protein [Ignavibacteriales bacterium]|nr:adenylate/guanylate cyclase domain-containing protein [Ignavibacteriales bacterium]
MTTSKKLQVTTALVVTSFLVVHLLFWLLPNVFEPWNAQTVDQLFAFRYEFSSLRVPYDSTVIHVDLKDGSIQKLANAYLNRTHYAQVVRNLGEMRVAAQIWDYIYRARSNDAEDQAFVDATRDAGHVYYGVAFDLAEQGETIPKPPRPKAHLEYLDRTKWNVVVEGDTSEMYMGENPIITFPELAMAAQGLGYLSIRFDRDGVFRRAPLLIKYNDGFYPSFPFRAVCEFLKVPPEKIILRPGKSVTLKDASPPGKIPHDIVIPVDDHCNLVINYIGPWERMKHYDFADVLTVSDSRDDLEIMGEEFEGRIAVVSEVSTGSSDIAPVPTDNNFPLSGLHANVLHTILTENFLIELTDFQMVFIEVLLMVIVLIFAFKLSSRGLRYGTVILLMGYLMSCASLFFYANVIVNIIRPSLMIVGSVFSIIAYRYINEEKEKESLRRSFEAYFPPAVVKKIMANPELVYAAGQKKELTIMFSDIKSFTTYSSTMSPEAIQKSLDEYFGAMVDIVFKYEGTVDKFIGDGLMVFYGDPEPQSDHALRCVKAAVEMQKKCRELKAKWESEGKFPLKIRIGINTGPVVVGNMGSSKRLSYTVLGSDVNLTQRLESNAPVEGIMISHRTYELVKDHVTTRPLEPIRVKGLDQPIQVYEVIVDGEATG